MAEQRLIDANAILYVEAVDGDTYEGTGKLYARKKDIDALPTIEERKTGKWIEMESAPGRCYYATCSKCMVTMTIEQDYHNFCPNCGADMREQP